MKTALVRLVALLALLATAALGGCVTGLGEGAGRAAAPPAPLPELPTTPPVPGMVWLAGAWHWSGTDHVWIPGRWESPPPSPFSVTPLAPSR